MSDELHRVEWRGALAGQYRCNVMHFHLLNPTADLPFGNANSLANWLHTNIKPKFLLCLPDDYILESLSVRRLGPTAGQYAQIDYAPQSQPGTRTGPAVSEQLCPCVTLIPPMGVKSAGRIFLPAVAKPDVNMNTYLAGYVTVVNNLMAAMVAGGTVAGGTTNIVIYSRKLNAASIVASYHLSTVIGYQRRRAHPVGS